ncbi:hypothetical protein DDZ16_10870 [Marinilabilia rubra]|uniref:Uncharacterized protein n=1 Tax=Marinilabilia rubra TaxID=2162893 RepID=A0A2U2B8V4_9BACT|nr:hypothetical protein DDZ16_10870 [Marinilabilia rubra]
MCFFDKNMKLVIKQTKSDLKKAPAQNKVESLLCNSHKLDELTGSCFLSFLKPPSSLAARFLVIILAILFFCHLM